MSMKNPPHPGNFIRTEIIEPSGLSITAAAAVLQVSRPALSSLLNGKADLSGNMALRIEKAFGVKMDTLMRMQSAFDIVQTRKREKEISVQRIHAPAALHHSRHFADHPCRIRNVVQAVTRHREVQRAIRERQNLRVANHKAELI